MDDTETGFDLLVEVLEHFGFKDLEQRSIDCWMLETTTNCTPFDGSYSFVTGGSNGKLLRSWGSVAPARVVWEANSHEFFSWNF